MRSAGCQCRAAPPRSGAPAVFFFLFICGRRIYFLRFGQNYKVKNLDALASIFSRLRCAAGKKIPQTKVCGILESFVYFSRLKILKISSNGSGSSSFFSSSAFSLSKSSGAIPPAGADEASDGSG